MPALDLRAGQVLGRYELLLPIAKGGMAQVWAARLRGSRGFQKVVAMKTILAGTMDDTSLEQMFLEEATLASQIHHPNVVETLDLGEHEGTLYLVMEWVDGEPLQLLLKEAREHGPIPLPIAVNIIGQACKGLHEAHELRDENGQSYGLVHRDISPHNILVTYSGTVKLVDFGIAKAMNRSSGLTEAGQVKGKSAFMSPEQMRSRPVDRRADVFAMGIVLYMITTGRHPFKRDDLLETMRNVCSDRPALPPSSIARGYPRKLQNVVMKALAKDPNNRWETAYEMLFALEDAVPGCLEASFEKNVQTYLAGLCGERAGKRREALRAAQEQADRAPEIVTGSTPRAWLTQNLGTGSNAPTGREENSVFGTAWAVRRPRWLVSAGAGAAALIAASILFFALRPGEPDGRAPAATLPAAPAAAPVAAAPPEPKPVETQPPVLARAAPELEPEPTKSSRRNEARAVRASPRSLPSVAPSSPATTTAPASAGVGTATPAIAKSAPETKPSSNAWDTKSFGGRH